MPSWAGLPWFSFSIICKTQVTYQEGNLIRKSPGGSHHAPAAGTFSFLNMPWRADGTYSILSSCCHFTPLLFPAAGSPLLVRKALCDWASTVRLRTKGWVYCEYLARGICALDSYFCYQISPPSSLAVVKCPALYELQHRGGAGQPFLLKLVSPKCLFFVSLDEGVTMVTVPLANKQE